MGRRTTWPPKVHPHGPSGRDRVRYRGKDYYLGPIGSAESRAAYLALVARLEAERGGDDPAAAVTVAQVVALWHVHAVAEYGADSPEVASYRAALAPVLRLYPALPAAGFAGPQLRAVQGDMAGPCGWARSHVNRCVVRVRTVFRWAEEAGHVPGGSWSALRAVKPLGRPRPGLREGRKVRPSEWWRVARAAVLGAAPGLRLHLLLGWLTGARPGELSGLTAGQIDTSGPVWVARLERHKTAWRGHSRVLYFGPEARELIAARLADCRPDDPLCPDGRGGHFDRRTLRQALHRACRRAGVEAVNPYQSRHAFAARVVRAHGTDAARALLGHTTASMTGHYSSEADAKLAEDAAKRAG